MNENTINQRLKILIEATNMNIRSFSRAYGLHEGNLRNYIDRGSKPPAEFISALVQSIDGLNAIWLLLGEGEMFLNGAAEPRAVYQKNNSGITIGTNHGIATQHHSTIAECEKDLKAANERITLLTSQLQDKERIIQLQESLLKK
jgi:hypothetical protein